MPGLPCTAENTVAERRKVGYGLALEMPDTLNGPAVGKLDLSGTRGQPILHSTVDCGFKLVEMQTNSAALCPICHFHYCKAHC